MEVTRIYQLKTSSVMTTRRSESQTRPSRGGMDSPPDHPIRAPQHGSSEGPIMQSPTGPSNPLGQHCKRLPAGPSTPLEWPRKRALKTLRTPPLTELSHIFKMSFRHDHEITTDSSENLYLAAGLDSSQIPPLEPVPHRLLY